MKDTEYAFAVSAARVRETKLLSRSQIDSLVGAHDEAAALRMLEDFGYTGITSDPEATLSARISGVTDFVTEVAPGDGVLSFLLIKNDFHNVKAYMKCAVTGTEPEGYLLTPVMIDVSLIAEAAQNKTWNVLPGFAAKPAEKAWDVLMETMNGQYAEMILDRAALETSVKLAEAEKDAFCIKLAKLYLKTAAFRIAVRCAAAHKGRELLELALPADDSYPRERLLSAALAGVEDVVALASENGFEVPEPAGVDSFEEAARRAEDALRASASLVNLGAAPLIVYYLRCDGEVSKIRKILSCKRCGLDESAIRERIGE